MPKYNPATIELKWQKYWEEHQSFAAPAMPAAGAAKLYALDMFPYPSGAGLHVGHLAVTDHETIEGALEAREAARTQAPDLTVIVGEEVRTREGDLIALYIERAVPRGLSVTETIAAVREQGGLIGVPHPFDRYRGSLLRALAGSAIETPVDWIEVHNARVMVGDGNAQAAAYAAVDAIDFPTGFCRRDIGWREVAREAQ